MAIPENTEKVRVHIPPKLIGIEIYDSEAFRRTLTAKCLALGLDTYAEGFTPAMTRFLLQGNSQRLGFTSCMYAFRTLKLVIEDLEHCVRPVLSEAKFREAQTVLYKSRCRVCVTASCASLGLDTAVRLLSCLPLETIRNMLLRDMVKRMSRAKVAEVLGVSRRVIQNWLTEIGER